MKISKAILKTYLEQAPDAISLSDLEGKSVYCNKKAEEITGYERAKLIGNNLFDINLISAAHEEKVKKLMYYHRAGKVTGPDELELIKENGDRLWVEINSTPIKQKGETMVLSIMRDITVQKQKDHRLMESEDRYRNLIESTSDLIQSTTPDGRFRFVNRAWKEALGYNKSDIASLNLLKIIKPEYLQSYHDSYSRVLAGKALRDIKISLIAKDKRSILLEGSTVPRYINGELIAIESFFHDITLRETTNEKVRHAAEEWRTTFDSIADAISIHDKDYKIVRVNKAFADIVHAKPKQLIGKYCYEVLHGTKWPLQKCPHQQTMRTKEHAEAEFINNKLGVYLQVSTSPIFNETGEILGSVHISRDITQRKRQEEQLIMTDRLASIGKLVSGIAHELNNPLTGVIGFAQLLKEASVPPSIKENLEIISHEAERAANIVGNLLTFAREHEPVRQLRNINNVIEDVLKLRAYGHKVNNIITRKHLARRLPEIMIDYFQMQQVFLNIIINAETAMLEAHRGGKLTISTRLSGNSIRISITDNGPGIAKENINRIFDPFFTTKEVGKGTGLGLSICHGIVSAHSGNICAKSKPGHGAVFIIKLPLNIS